MDNCHCLSYSYPMSTQEYERLALLTESDYKILLGKFRESLAQGNEQNITSIWYVADAVKEYVKLDHNHTHATAKLVYKNKDEFSRTELETPIQIEELNGLDAILTKALKGDRYVSEQIRHDFFTPEKLSISLKYTTDMKWHVEIEAPKSLGFEDSARLVEQFAQKFGLKLLSEAEEKKLYDEMIAARKS